MPNPQAYRKWFAAIDFVLMVVCIVLAWNTLARWHGPTAQRYLYAAIYCVLAIFFAARSWRRRQRPPV